MFVSFIDTVISLCRPRHGNGQLCQPLPRCRRVAGRGEAGKHKWGELCAVLCETRAGLWSACTLLAMGGHTKQWGRGRGHSKRVWELLDLAACEAGCARSPTLSTTPTLSHMRCTAASAFVMASGPPWCTTSAEGAAVIGSKCTRSCGTQVGHCIFAPLSQRCGPTPRLAHRQRRSEVVADCAKLRSEPLSVRKLGQLGQPNNVCVVHTGMSWAK